MSRVTQKDVDTAVNRVNDLLSQHGAKHRVRVDRFSGYTHLYQCTKEGYIECSLQCGLTKKAAFAHIHAMISTIYLLYPDG